ncbi:MAG: aminotransferase class I/II-fold pyridoxal phosphate-dependent enzyme [Acidimicrobiales bacterium]
MDAVERTLAATLRHGDRVAVEDPGYPPCDRRYAPGPRSRTRAGGPRGTVGGRARRPPWPAARRAAIVAPRAQDPTGATALSEDRADALRAVLARHADVVLVEDDHLGLLGHDVPTLAGATRRWVLARSVSKALGPDLRVALVAGDDDTVDAVATRLRAGPGWVSHVLQATVADLLVAPDTAPALARAWRAYGERREALLDALAARGVAAEGPTGFNVWVPVADETSTCLALADRGWGVGPGGPFRIATGPGVRITTARLHPSDAERLADDVAAVVEGTARPR